MSEVSARRDRRRAIQISRFNWRFLYLEVIASSEHFCTDGRYQSAKAGWWQDANKVSPKQGDRHERS
jgi:hypothetical protein